MIFALANTLLAITVTLLPLGIQTRKVIVVPAATATSFTYAAEVPAAVPLKVTASDRLPA